MIKIIMGILQIIVAGLIACFNTSMSNNYELQTNPMELVQTKQDSSSVTDNEQSLTITIQMLDPVTGDEVTEYPDYANSVVIASVEDYIKCVCDTYGYSTCSIIECCDNPMYTSVCVHFMFNDRHYMCAMFDTNTGEYENLYNKLMTTN